MSVFHYVGALSSLGSAALAPLERCEFSTGMLWQGTLPV